MASTGRYLTYMVPGRRQTKKGDGAFVSMDFVHGIGLGFRYLGRTRVEMVG